MFKPFSNGYYIGFAFVKPDANSNTPEISPEQYDVIEQNIYNQSNNHPMMKLKSDTGHFPISCGANLPPNTLTIPSKMVPESFQASGQHVLLAKPNAGIHQMLRLTDTSVTIDKQ
jgi:hypothetical protein